MRLVFEMQKQHDESGLKDLARIAIRANAHERVLSAQRALRDTAETSLQFWVIRRLSMILEELEDSSGSISLTEHTREFLADFSRSPVAEGIRSAPEKIGLRALELAACLFLLGAAEDFFAGKYSRMVLKSLIETKQIDAVSRAWGSLCFSPEEARVKTNQFRTSCGLETITLPTDMEFLGPFKKIGEA